MANAGDSGGSPYRVRYGHDIFCNGRRVDPGGGNEGEVADLFSRCLHAKVRQSELIDPRTKEEYETAVDKAAREMFRAICLEDRRKFVQASTNQPMQDREAIEILKVELMELRNTIKIRMKRAAAAAAAEAAERDQRRQRDEQQRQQREQARRDEERARRDREEFEREQLRRQSQHRRHPPPNGTSAGGGGGRDRWCANPVSPSPAYAFGGDHPAWGGMGMGQRRQGSDHDVFASASACDSDGGERGALKIPAAGPPKPDKLTQVRQRMAEMQRKRKGKESEEKTRGDDRAPNRGGGNVGGGSGGGGRGAPSSSFRGHIPRKRSAAGDNKARGNKSGQKQSNKKQNVGEKHRFKKLVSATEASSPPPKRKPIWEPPPGRTHAPTNSLPPTSPGRRTANGKAISSGENQSIERSKIIGNMPQQARPTSPGAPAEMPEASDLAKTADTANEDEMAAGFDMDDTESLPSVSANATLGESESQLAISASPGVGVEFSSDASPFSKKRGLKVSRKKAASESSSSKGTGSKRSVDKVVEVDDNSALPSKVNKNQDALKAKKRLTEESAEEAAVPPVDVPLSSIVGLDGIVTIEPMGWDAYEKLQNPVMKGRSHLSSEKLPPWPARIATGAESKKCLEEYWEAKCDIARNCYVCVHVFYPPPRHFDDNDSSSDFSFGALTSPPSPPRGPECGVEFVHFSRIRPLFEDKRLVTAESSWSEYYHRAWNVAAALRQWALGSNMAVRLEEKIQHFPQEQVGDYGVVFSIKKEEWDSASHIGAQTVLNLILSNALVRKHTTYSAEKYATARAARYQQLGYPSGTTLKAFSSQSNGVAPSSSTEASFSNVLNLLGDDDDEDEITHEDDLFSDGDVNRRRDVVSTNKCKGTRQPQRTSRVVYDPTQDSTMDFLDDIVGSDGIVMVTGNDAKRSIHHPWPARIASAEESDEHRLREMKIGRDVDPYKICVFYFLPCWGDTTELAGGVERWYFCDFVDSSRIHGFDDPDIDLNGMSDDIVLRYKRAWTIAAGLRYWSSGLDAETPRKPHKCKVNGCPRIHEKIRDYGPVLKIKDNEWVDGSNTLNPDSIVKVINKFLVSKGICRFSYSNEKSRAARGDLGANYSSWLRGRSINDGDAFSPAQMSKKTARSESSRPSRSHDLFIAYDDSRGGVMTNGGAKIPVKSEDNGTDEARKVENTRGTKMELVKIQNVGEFCVKEDEVGSKTMKIFKDFAAVDKNKSTEENRLAKLVEDACNRLVVLEGKLSAHGINPDD